MTDEAGPPTLLMYRCMGAIKNRPADVSAAHNNTSLHNHLIISPADRTIAAISVATVRLLGGKSPSSARHHIHTSPGCVPSQMYGR